MLRKPGPDVVLTIGITLLTIVSAPAEGAQAPASAGLLRTYCITCHNDTLKTAGLVLETLDSEGLPIDPAIGEKVLRKLRTDAMPPAGRRRPDLATRTAFVSRLETALDSAAAATPYPGRPAPFID